MTQEEKIKAASYTMMKGYNYEQMMYSDEMYGKSEHMDDVWNIVIEIEENGLQWFRNYCKENNFKIYPI